MIMEYMNCAYNRFMITLHLRRKGGGLTSSTAASPSSKADCGDEAGSGGVAGAAQGPSVAVPTVAGPPAAAVAPACPAKEIPRIASSNEAAINA